MKILICCENQLEMLKLNIEMMRILESGSEIEIYVADNASSDGTAGWLSQQSDLSYVYFDEGRVGFFELLGEAMRIFGIERDILVLQCRYFLMPQTLKRLEEFLSRFDAEAAVVGLYSNGFGQGEQYIPMKEYGAKVPDHNPAFPKEAEMLYLQRLGVEAGAFYLHGDVCARLGGLDRKLWCPDACMADCFFACTAGELPVVLPFSVIPLYDALKGKQNDARIGREEAERLRDKWKTGYASLYPDTDLVNPVAEGKNRAPKVLEIGCGMGATLLAVQNRLPKAVLFGVEAEKEAAAFAGRFANVVCADPLAGLPFEETAFDYIILGDVLERLYDPERMLRLCRERLKEGGVVLAKVSNLMHVSVMKQLLRGEFAYTEGGLPDREHIRFFTYHEIRRMFERAGYQSFANKSIRQPLSQEEQGLIPELQRLGQGAESWMYEAVRYVVRAGK